MAYTPGSGAVITLGVDGAPAATRDVETVGDALRRLNNQSLRGVNDELSTVQSTVGRVRSSFSNLVAGAAAVVTIGAFAGWIKGAIDAADETSKLSQKTGVAVKDIAGIKLAFDLGGVSGDVFAKTMGKLSVAIVEGNKGLAALDIKTRDANGALRTSKDVLYSVADSFAKMEDGVTKAALANEIFGKSGADLIPLLNGGAAGFREMDEMAAKLGLTIDESTAKSAEAFNDNLDLLQLGSKGVATGIAAQLLPTLTALTGSFLTSMTSGDKLKNTAEFLGTGLKLLYTIAVGLSEAFSTVGKMIGGVATIISTQITGAIDVLSKMAGGDFKGAWESAKGAMGQLATVSDSVTADIKDGWRDTGTTIAAAWSTEGNAAVEAQAKLLKANSEIAAAAERRAAAAKKAKTDHDAAMKTANDYLQSLQAEAAQVGMTSEQIKMMSAARVAAKAPTEALRDGIMKQAAANIELNRVQALNMAAKKAATKLADDEHAALAAVSKGIDDQIATMRRQIQTYGLTEEAVIALALSEAEATRAAGGYSEAKLLALDEQIQKLRILQGLAGQKSVLETAKKGADEIAAEGKRMADSIESSLTDALLRGFESGKGFGRNLVDTLQNMFRTLVLRPVISAIVNPVAGALTGALGVSGAAQAAGTGAAGTVAGGAAGALAGGLFGAGGMAGALAGGAGWLTGATTLSGALGAGGALVGTGTLAGGMAGATMIVGALAPIALGIAAAVAIWKKLDTSGTYHTGGGATASKGGVTTMAAESLGFAATRTNPEIEKMVAGLAGGIVSILDSTATAFGKTAGYTAATAFADDSSKDGAWGGLLIKKMGETVLDWNSDRSSRWAPKEFADGKAGQEQYLAALSASVRTALDGIGMPAWAQKMLDSLGAAPSLEEMAKVVDAINQTQTALVQMGDKLVGFASMSETAVSALISAAGGIDALASSASEYYDIYYSDAEKMAEVQKQLTEAITEAGIAMPTTRDEYRAQVEAQMALGEAGAGATAVLLKNAAAFAELHPLVETATAALEVQSDALAKAQVAFVDSMNRVQPGAVVAEVVGGMDEETRRFYAMVAQEAADAAARMRETWTSLTDSVSSEVKRIRGQLVGSGAAGLAAAKGNFAVATAQARAGDEAAARMLPLISQAMLQLAEVNSATVVDLNILRANTAASLSDTARITAGRAGLPIPAFAAGGDFFGGLRIVGENGPELEATGPSRIFNASQTSLMLSGGGADLVDEVRALRAEVIRLREDNSRENVTAIKHAQRGADILEAASIGEVPLMTEVAA